MRIPLLASAGVGACALALAVAVPAAAASSHNVSATVFGADSGSRAVTYDPAVVPTGAQMSVNISQAADGTVVALEVDGLLPNRGYAAHAHVNPCGATGADAGPHFQHAVDPAAGPDHPSVDPAYANADNEVWLDLQTDANGDGRAEADSRSRSPATGRRDRSSSTRPRRPRPTPDMRAPRRDRAACITLPVT